MYGFEPTEEQAMLVGAVKRYAAQHLRPAAREADEAGELPRELIEKGWELGILQASIPEAYGGFGGHSALTGVLAAEELAWGDLAGAMAVMVPGTFALPILMCGSEKQKQEWLPPVIESQWKPYVAALIEPRYDFYPGDLSTSAKLEDGSYVLDGEKAYVPFADQAISFLVFASLDGHLQAFVVPSQAEGLEVGDREQLMGIKALPTFSLKLTGVRVPVDWRLAGDAGYKVNAALAASQAAVASMAVGLSKAAYEYALKYAKQREAFDQYIAQKQSIAFMLAEMITEIEATRLLVWEAAWLLDEQREGAQKSAYLALTGASDMAMMVTDRAVQILGGHGYVREHPVELWMRNGRGVPNFTGLAMV